ncbi:MAG: alpha/beta fold hydrolase [Deltaproteobacteria bacterium]|nr:alpha/beta fold hydrolase [Deltaproteobacteria bacterium]
MNRWIGRADGDGRALVLVHGAGGNHTVWAKVFGALRKAGVPTMALDLPGHGASSGPPRGSVGECADAVERIVAEAGIRRYAVAGHSLGGAIALTLAARGAQGLLGLGAVSTGARLPVDPKILEGVRSNFSCTVENLCRFVFAKGTERKRIEEAAEMMAAAGPEAVYADFAACASYGLTVEELGAIRVPAEIVCGDSDVLSPVALSEELAAGIPGARLTLLPGCGHMPLLEAPEELAGALAELWRRAGDT